VYKKVDNFATALNFTIPSISFFINIDRLDRIVSFLAALKIACAREI
jgi:hypothetical protein